MFKFLKNFSRNIKWIIRYMKIKKVIDDKIILRGTLQDMNSKILIKAQVRMHGILFQVKKLYKIIIFDQLGYMVGQHEIKIDESHDMGFLSDSTLLYTHFVFYDIFIEIECLDFVQFENKVEEEFSKMEEKDKFFMKNIFLNFSKKEKIGVITN